MDKKKVTIRCLDRLGRVVIPKSIRDKFEISEADPIEIFVDRNTIILRKFEPNCVFCQSTRNLIEFKEKLICKDCKSKINSFIKRRFD